MKLKQKLIMDGIMMILLLVLMNYDLTGGLIHEFLGIVIRKQKILYCGDQSHK